MPIVPKPDRFQKDDPDVCPATPFGPGPKEWPGSIDLTVGVGEIRDVTPDSIFHEYEETIHFHPGPLGFAPGKKKRRRKK